MPARYLGLMSGTSLDGVDAGIFEFSPSPQQLHARSYALPEQLRDRFLAIQDAAGDCNVDSLGRLDHAIAVEFARAARQLIEDSGINPREIIAIGSHGQTLWHAPQGDNPFTWQLGDPSLIAASTGLPVVADFRRMDMALGGQGAPLACGFHLEIFGSLGDVAVLNLGGIANVTLVRDGKVTGFDTGPANALLDRWHAARQGGHVDRDGRWAASGKLIDSLLESMLADPFFATPPPRSTGKEYFNLKWLQQQLQGNEDAADVQATLCELSARSIAEALNAAKARRVIAVGGGVHNAELMRRLAAQLDAEQFGSSAEYGFDPDFVEAAAFAWLAMRRMEEQPGNLPTVTGASRSAILGGVYLPW